MLTVTGGPLPDGFCHQPHEEHARKKERRVPRAVVLAYRVGHRHLVFIISDTGLCGCVVIDVGIQGIDHPV